jgi:hypothetical protein
VDTYFGLLHVLEDVNVYGFLTNTLIKILVMVEGVDGTGGIRDSDVKTVEPLSPRLSPLLACVLGASEASEGFEGEAD